MNTKCPCCFKDVTFFGKQILAGREVTECPQCKMFVSVNVLKKQIEKLNQSVPNIVDLPEEVLQKDVTYKLGKYYFDNSVNTKKCIHCNNDFTPKRSDAKTCSSRCRVAVSRQKKQITSNSDAIRWAVRAVIADVFLEQPLKASLAASLETEICLAVKDPAKYFVPDIGQTS